MIFLSDEATIDVFGGKMYFRSTRIQPERNTLLFLHGLGDSGLTFMEAFQQSALQKFNILAPDFLGFGNSSAASEGGYLFSAQIKRIVDLLDSLSIASVHLIGHSMGGVIGTQLCTQQPGRVNSFINVEGTLTPSDRFITSRVIDADQQGRFRQWFRDDFIGRIVVDWGKKRMSCRRYLISLSRCLPEAFLESAKEIYKMGEISADSSDGESESAKAYRALLLAKVYCWGTESLSDESQKYLANTILLNHAFEGAAHWVMQDRREAFYNFLAGFLAGLGAM